MVEEASYTITYIDSKPCSDESDKNPCLVLPWCFGMKIATFHTPLEDVVRRYHVRGNVEGISELAVFL